MYMLLLVHIYIYIQTDWTSKLRYRNTHTCFHSSQSVHFFLAEERLCSLCSLNGGSLCFQSKRGSSSGALPQMAKSWSSASSDSPSIQESTCPNSVVVFCCLALHLHVHGILHWNPLKAGSPNPKQCSFSEGNYIPLSDERVITAKRKSFCWSKVRS